jgi:hypothetical protein
MLYYSNIFVKRYQKSTRLGVFYFQIINLGVWSWTLSTIRAYFRDDFDEFYIPDLQVD